MKTINKDFQRLKKFRDAYPELTKVPNRQIQKCFLNDREVKKSVDRELKELVGLAAF
jgi:hypothetical protein